MPRSLIFSSRSPNEPRKIAGGGCRVCTSSAVAVWRWPGASPLPLVCRGGLTYTFVVGNSGINSVSGVTIRDPLMPGLILDSFTAPAFSGGCAVDPSNVVTCTGGALGPESITTVTFVTVAPSVVGTVTNTVTVDPNNAIFEADDPSSNAGDVLISPRRGCW